MNDARAVVLAFQASRNDLASAAPPTVQFGEVDIMEQRGVTTLLKVQQYPTLYVIDSVSNGGWIERIGKGVRV